MILIQYWKCVFLFINAKNEKKEGGEREIDYGFTSSLSRLEEGRLLWLTTALQVTEAMEWCDVARYRWEETQQRNLTVEVRTEKQQLATAVAMVKMM
jgi:hypothetical protein